jgi:RIO-like serine/threonine protein kinase
VPSQRIVDRTGENGDLADLLLHGDLSAGNMIVGQQGQRFLVDWEKCSPGPVERIKDSEKILFSRIADLQVVT